DAAASQIGHDPALPLQWDALPDRDEDESRLLAPRDGFEVDAALLADPVDQFTSVAALPYRARRDRTIVRDTQIVETHPEGNRGGDCASERRRRQHARRECIEPEANGEALRFELDLVIDIRVFRHCESDRIRSHIQRRHPEWESYRRAVTGGCRND